MVAQHGRLPGEDGEGIGGTQSEADRLSLAPQPAGAMGPVSGAYGRPVEVTEERGNEV
jgi:hypothetical protein